MCIFKYSFIVINIAILLACYLPSANGYDGIGSPLYYKAASKQSFGAKHVYDMVQDKAGILIAATDEGLIAFDGAVWTRMKGFENFHAEELMYDNDDVLWVATFNEVGFINKSNDGEWDFHSISQTFPDGISDLKLWSPEFQDDDGTYYFTTHKNIVSWHPKKGARKWSPAGYAYGVFKINGEIFCLTDYPIIEQLLPDGTTKPFPHPEDSPDLTAARIWTQKNSNDSVFISSQNNGIIEFDGTHYKLVANNQKQFNGSAPEEILAMENGNFLVEKQSGGLTLLSEDFEHISDIDVIQEVKIRDLDYLYQDHQGGIWLGQPRGIFRLDLEAELSIFDQSSGIKGKVTDIEEHGGSIFFSTEFGVFKYLKNPPTPEETFVEIGVRISSRILISNEDEMLIGTVQGLTVYKDGAVSSISNDIDAGHIEIDPFNDNILYSGGSRGLHLYIKTNGSWVYDHAIDESIYIHGVFFDNEGLLWIKTGIQGAAYYNPRETNPEIHYYGKEDGLPSAWLNPLRIEEQVFLSGTNSLQRLDRETMTWKKETEYKDYSESNIVYGFMNLVVKPTGEEWVNLDGTSGNLAPSPKGQFLPGLKLLDSGTNLMGNAFVTDSTGITWIANGGGIVRSRHSPINRPHEKPTTILSKVEDLITGEVYFQPMDNKVKELSLSSKQNSLRFYFGTNDFSTLGENHYQVFLEGYHETRPPYTSESVRDFTKLPHGEYTLNIQITNDYGQTTDNYAIKLTIETPWFAQSWAIATYCFLFAALVYSIIAIRQKSIKKLNTSLRKQVKERTQELQTGNELLKKTLRKSEKLADEAQSAGIAKTQFLANMSHEIRTPMNGVMGMCTLLQDTKLDGKQRDFVSTIKKSSETLLTVINDILDFSKIEAGKLDLEKIPFQLDSMVEDILDLLAPQALQKNLELLYHVEGEVKNTRIGDPTRLRQILVNLVGNAIKFTNKGEVVVRIKNHTDQNKIQFNIQDTGIGIDEAHLKDLFKSFSQADSSTSRKYGGTGLGLTISKMLSEVMGGGIIVQSQVGVGSTFSFHINMPFDDSVIESNTNQSILRGKTILIIDDNHTNRQILEKICHNWSMLSVQADGARTALEILKSPQELDGILLDFHMPETSGLDLVAQMRKLHLRPDLPIMLLSSVGQSNISDSTEELGIKYSLAKPIRRNQLENTLIHLLQGTEITQIRYESTGAITKVEGINNLRILLVEDNPTNQKVATLLLKRIGFATDVAGNGLEAIQSATRLKYDLILMDVQMPEMDGLEATKIIRKKLPQESQPYIYAMTAGVTEADQQECKEAGMDGFIRKPVKIDELKNAIEEVLKIVKDKQIVETSA